MRFLSKSSKIADSDVKSIQRIVNDCAVQRENILLPKEPSSTVDDDVFSSSQPYISFPVSSSSVAVAAVAAAAAATICDVKKGGQRSVLSMTVESSR